jgi:hypothetical protein
VRPDTSKSIDRLAGLPDCGPEGLSTGERLLLWMLRQWVAARVLGEEPRGRLAAHAGAFISPRGAAAFVLLMTTIEERVRRPLCVSPPTCLGYARDEQHLVTACGISPAAPDIAARLLSELVIAPRVVAAAVRVLNFSFAREGLHFPMRLRDAGYNLDDGSRPTLH